MADRHSDSPFHFMQIATAAAVALFAANMCAKKNLQNGLCLKKDIHINFLYATILLVID